MTIFLLFVLSCLPAAISNMSSSTNRIWLLQERNDDYRSLKRSDPKEYFAGVRRE